MARRQSATTLGRTSEVGCENVRVIPSIEPELARARSYDRGRFSAKRENGVHHFQSLVSEFLARG
jgi:choline monooxygenase